MNKLCVILLVSRTLTMKLADLSSVCSSILATSPGKHVYACSTHTWTSLGVSMQHTFNSLPLSFSAQVFVVLSSFEQDSVEIQILVFIRTLKECEYS